MAGKWTAYQAQLPTQEDRPIIQADKNKAWSYTPPYGFALNFDIFLMKWFCLHGILTQAKFMIVTSLGDTVIICCWPQIFPVNILEFAKLPVHPSIRPSMLVFHFFFT